jgi:membrane associated rhomboid family serine protease
LPPHRQRRRPSALYEQQQQQQRRPSRWLENAAFAAPSSPGDLDEGGWPRDRRQRPERRRRSGSTSSSSSSSSPSSSPSPPSSSEGGGGEEDVELGRRRRRQREEQKDEDEDREEDGDSYDDDVDERCEHDELAYDDAEEEEDDDGDDDPERDNTRARPSHAGEAKAAAAATISASVPGALATAAATAATAATAAAAAAAEATPRPPQGGTNNYNNSSNSGGGGGGGATRAAAAPASSPSPSLVPVRRSIAEAFLVPDGRTRYWPAFTLAATVLFGCVFCFMAGGYGGYLAHEQEQQRLAAAAAAATAAGSAPSAAAAAAAAPPLLWWGATPRSMRQWLAFWRPTPQTTFSWPYLAAWGGRYAPALLRGRGGGWRVVASLALHASTAHLLSNLLVFLLLSSHLEHSYGPLRVGLAFFASCLGGTFLSLAFEDPCALYVGASGGVYGLVGLYVLSIAVNHESMPLWWLRLAAMAASLCFMVAVAASSSSPSPSPPSPSPSSSAAAAPPPSRSGTSHLSHVGGFLTGLLAAFLFLPNFADRRWLAARRVAERLGRALPGAGWSSGSGGGSDGGRRRQHFASAAPSCWRVRRPLYRAAVALSVSSAVFLMVALPVYAWTSLLPGLTCPDEDALLASLDAPER